MSNDHIAYETITDAGQSFSIQVMEKGCDFRISMHTDIDTDLEELVSQMPTDKWLSSTDLVKLGLRRIEIATCHDRSGLVEHTIRNGLSVIGVQVGDIKL